MSNWIPTTERLPEIGQKVLAIAYPQPSNRLERPSIYVFDFVDCPWFAARPFDKRSSPNFELNHDCVMWDDIGESDFGTHDIRYWMPLPEMP